MTNHSGLAGEINLDDAAGAVIGEIETIGPRTSAPLTATLGSGTYTFKCLMGSLRGHRVAAGQVRRRDGRHGNTAAAIRRRPVAVKPVTVAELLARTSSTRPTPPRSSPTWPRPVAAIEADLRHGNLAQAKKDWLDRPARLGAGRRVLRQLRRPGPRGGRAAERPALTASTTRASPACTGSSTACGTASPPAELLPVAATLEQNVATVQKNLTSDDLAGDPTQLPLRAHEIIEDALRDHLSGIDDQGSRRRVPDDIRRHPGHGPVLGYLARLINARQPGLVATADSQLSALKQALLATRANGQWQSLAQRSPSAARSTSTRPWARCSRRWPPFLTSLKFPHRAKAFLAPLQRPT